MLFKVSLYISLSVFVIGVIYHLASWFLRDIGTGDKSIPSSARFLAAMKGILGAVFSGKIFPLIRALIIDVLLQLRILKDRSDPLLWPMHMFIFVGFLMLLLMHALGSILTSSIFSDYQSTLNPFMFLRNLFGLSVVIGLVLAIVRRRITGKVRLRTTGMDYIVILLLTTIIVFGYLHEGSKIGSYASYQLMVEEYADATDEDEFRALEAYWVKNFGVVSPKTHVSTSAEILEKGRDVDEVSCASCHSLPQWAFISYGASRIMRPVARLMDRAQVPNLFWTIHFLAGFVGLAYLPFSKMFHMFATPISLLVAAGGGGDEEEAPNAATRQVIELVGCSHGGTCHSECPIRQKRQDRIDRTAPFGPSLDNLGEKSWVDLGCRSFET